MNSPTPEECDSDRDLALRKRLQAALAQSPREGDDEDLQARVMAQWRQSRSPSQVVASGGPAATLQAAWRQQPRVWIGALVLLLGLWLLRPAPDPALEELLQPDVLTLISNGEL